ncbi:DUF294 nucleotidyltransferase-like domain-containing protein [Paenibacillus doosanensis]|uniref:DUF294 nucleotidyltransferase-like domain-containing protein n=1 Tax=Paenibacillus doosanensis TaxID=1229154 RepID=UPI0021802CD9|nr:DUF294 nucleotidyltransferase-like domain-containing protein [Paenibacillus doosanensis]MCS7460142.1 DUF294 nucleotidyltransferase-like domain-containing protein [Paenibacillus doosanensis]
MERLPMETIRAEIKAAADMERLRQYRDRLHEEFERNLCVSHSLDWNRELNQAHDWLIARSVRLAEEALLMEGAGKAPGAYAFVLFGSGGRGEQTLWSDQDNGLIYEDAEDERAAATAEAYFRILADRIGGYLQLLGYPLCVGGVICTNDKWRKPWSHYQSTLHEWLVDPNWEHIRYLLILADMRAVYGERSLASRLMDQMYAYAERHPAILEHMLHNTLHHKISLGVFGQLIRERYGEDAGGVDIKYGAYIPIVNGIRLLAIEKGVRAESTEGRIAGLLEGGFVEEEIAQDWLEALAIAVKLRSLTPFQLEDGHYTTRGKLPADRLTKERTAELKLCLRIGGDLQKYVRKSVHKEIEQG